jgi:16S rRNA processing protein RimM
MAHSGSTGPTRTAGKPTPEADGSWVWLGRIRRPQGRKGEVFTEILTDFPEKFAERKRLWLLSEKTPAKTAVKPSVPGRDFNRAENRLEAMRALAPETQYSVSAAPREMELAAHWLHKGGVVLHFAGVDSISAAETLSGLIVAIPRTERAALGEDEVYTGDLIGCALVDVAGDEPFTVGEIEDVDTTAGPVALLVVRGAAGEVLVPFAKSYLRKVDLGARRVEMALPEGLVDLNAAGKAQ